MLLASRCGTGGRGTAGSPLAGGDARAAAAAARGEPLPCPAAGSSSSGKPDPPQPCRPGSGQRRHADGRLLVLLLLLLLRRRGSMEPAGLPRRVPPLLLLLFLTVSGGAPAPGGREMVAGLRDRPRGVGGLGAVCGEAL